MKTFGGNVLFLDRDNINTDEIIPAKYLNEASKQALGPFLLEDLKLDGFDPKHSLKQVGAIVTRSNFGCGSSREHAPWALEANGINIVIAESFARIFRQNMFNCGMIACELSFDVISALFCEFAGQKTTLKVDLENEGLLFSSASGAKTCFPFLLNGFERDLVKSGGWVDYAARRY